VLRNPQFVQTVLGSVAQSAQPNVNLGEIGRFPIPSIPLESQHEIASVLGALDDKIELNRQMNQTLEATALAIFKDWFVDFGPTRAKMRGRASYFAPGVWSLFPDALNGDGIPDGWERKTLGDIAQQVGESVSPDALDPETPYIGLEHMPRRSIALTDWAGAGKVTSGKLAFRTGDFLFGKLRPYFHKVGIAPLDGICSTDIVVLNARERKAAPFVLACISQDEFVAFTDRTSDGTKMPRTSWGRMERYELCLPSMPTLEAFNALIEPALDRIVSNVHESRTLAATRDFLLPKLISGEIHVKAGEKNLREAT
jgi:type I restriction enzyme S subunit